MARCLVVEGRIPLVAVADPHRDVGGFQGPVHDTGQVIFDRIQAHEPHATPAPFRDRYGSARNPQPRPTPAAHPAAELGCPGLADGNGWALAVFSRPGSLFSSLA